MFLARALMLRLGLLAGGIVLSAGFAASAREDLTAPFPAIVGADAEGLRAWLKDLNAGGYRPVLVQPHLVNLEPAYTGFATREVSPNSWELCLDPGVAAWGRTFERLAARDSRLMVLAGLPASGGGNGGNATTTEFLSLWQRGQGPPWACYVDQTRQSLQGKLAEHRGKGLEPVLISSYSSGNKNGGATLHSVLFSGAPQRGERMVRTGLSERSLQELLEQAQAERVRVISLTAHPAARGVGTRFNVILSRDRPVPFWDFELDLSADELQAEHLRRVEADERPVALAGYVTSREPKYLGLWERFTTSDLPATGAEVPELAAVEDVFRRFLLERAVPAATLAVVHDGKLVLERGYGYLDRESTRPVPPETPFRIASLSKPVTAAAVRKLASQGKLDLEAKVVNLLEMKPPEGRELDPRWGRITVEHLLNHRGGWDRDQAFDPMFRAVEIAKELGTEPPATARDVLHYMAGQPLQFEPGERRAYSNFGYSVLGRLIEETSGMTYLDYVKQEVLDPISASGMAVGRSLPADRDGREPFYSDGTRLVNVFHPQQGEVPAPDGGFYLEAMDSHGGLVSAAIGYARFVASYHMNGEPCRPGETRGYDEVFFGSLTGTFTLAFRRPDGTIIVALCNQRADRSGLPYEPLREQLDTAARNIVNWPEGLPLFP